MSTAEVEEEVIDFCCGGARLWGIASRPPPARVAADTAVLIVVGGPQYRVGSHRQFVLLARGLAAAGYTALRFDYAGMGDSEGHQRSFEAIAPDLRAALDALASACPRARRFVLWGLCDGASAALMFASDEPRVAGIVAANPWARSNATLARTHLKHYYIARLLQRDFWRKLLRGGLQWRESLQSLRNNLAGARSPREAVAASSGTFQAAMARGLTQLRGRVLLLLSGNDLTAREFIEYAESSLDWRGLLRDPKVSRVDLVEADHTFSQRRWLDRAIDETVVWLGRIDTTVAASPAA